MVAKMTWEEMVEAACDSNGNKWMSRQAIKGFLTKNHGYDDSPKCKANLKKALVKFEKKGDSYKKKKAAGALPSKK